MSKVWFVTGASKGFGRYFVEAALGQGDQVVATARDVATLQGFADAHGDNVLAQTLDVTDKAAVDHAIEEAVGHFGRLDVVVNNAGYGLFGAVEEISEQELRAQLDTNLFGALYVTQAVLPHMRAQGSGHIVQISTVGGVMSFPLLGGYHASKWALEGLSESLAQEVAEFGITVTLVEPGAFDTDWGGSSAVWAAPNSVYDGARQALTAFTESDDWTPGNPSAVGGALLEVVNSDTPPLRVFFGTTGPDALPGIYAERLKTWADWHPVSVQAQGN